jgi:predicted glycoside hydrolase/deacetylase ChbG (UPF0249 family)
VAPTTDERVLIVNADDFGIAEGVNNGIREAHHAGVVTSTSLLANGVAFDHAVAIANGADRVLGIGVHLDFVQGRPLTSARTLVDDRTGHFQSLSALTRRALLGRVDPHDVMTEAVAQIERVRRAGLAITHVDSHRHAHLLPGVWGAVVDAAASTGIRFVRVPVERRSPDANLGATLKMLALRAAARVAASVRPPSCHTDNFIGLSLQGRHHFATLLLRALNSLPRGTTELMVHPGHADASLGALDSYRTPREGELRALLSAPVRERLRRGDIRLTHFGTLA